NMTLRLCCAWIFILLLPGLSDGGKHLVVPMDGSHWLSMWQVVEKLTERGHKVVVLIPEVSWQMKTTQAYMVKIHPVSYTLEELDGSLHEYILTHLKALALQNVLKTLSKVLMYHCKNLFSNRECNTWINRSHFLFDAVLTDPVIPCGKILAEHLSVPSVFFLRGTPCGLDFEATQCPSPPSYVPRIFTDHTDRMNFLQRVKILIFDIPNSLLCEFLFQPYTKLSSEFLQRDVTVPDLLRQASIWLMKLDFVLHYLRPLMPNMIM
ncbi:UDP-glucuronosyltransferase 1-1, partial [Eudyptula minor]